MGDVKIPPPVPTDSEPVSTTLETAAALWQAGNRVEAARVLARAAAMSSIAGDEPRGAALSAAAADLMAILGIAGPDLVDVDEDNEGDINERQTMTEPVSVAELRAAAFPVQPRPAFRVAVRPSTTEPGRLSVRVLGDGEPMEDGSHEALLVGVDPHVDLLPRRGEGG